VLNQSMIDEPPPKLAAGVEVVRVRANEIAEGVGSPKAGNIVMLGALLAARPIVSLEAVLAALPAALHVTDEERIRQNREALQMGAREAQRHAVAES
jgi:2-oxoglutarate ferredoxin oxidoreductase subunit gamma